MCRQGKIKGYCHEENREAGKQDEFLTEFKPTNTETFTARVARFRGPTHSFTVAVRGSRRDFENKVLPSKNWTREHGKKPKKAAQFWVLTPSRFSCTCAAADETLKNDPCG